MAASTSCHSRFFSLVKENLLLVLTLIGVACGVALGVGLYYWKPSVDLLLWIGFPGELMLRAFRMLILPLIVSSIISITADGSIKANGLLGGYTMLYMIGTNLLGAALGLVSVLIIRPGAASGEGGGGGGGGHSQIGSSALTTSDIITDLLRNLVPDSVVTLAFQTSQTVYREVSTNGTVQLQRENSSSSGMNVLGAVFASAMFGITAASIGGEDVAVFVRFFKSLVDISTRLLRLVVWTLPIGLLSLIASSLAVVESMEQAFISLGAFMGAVALALLVDQLVVHSAIYVAFVRANPLPYYVKLVRAYLVSFSATNTISALPLMLEAADKSGHRPRISRFVLPLCCSSNADGSCAFIAAAVGFVANFSGLQLSFGNCILIVFLAGVSGLSLPSVPSSSLVVIIGILSNLGIPATAVSLLYTGEFLLDRLRTGTNCWSHCTCAAVMNARAPLSMEELEAQSLFISNDAAGSSTAVAVGPASAAASDQAQDVPLKQQQLEQTQLLEQQRQEQQRAKAKSSSSSSNSRGSSGRSRRKVQNNLPEVQV